MPHRYTSSHPGSRRHWLTYALPPGDQAHSVLLAEIHLMSQDMDQAFTMLSGLKTEAAAMKADLEDVKKLKRYLAEGGKLLWACFLFALAFAGKLDWGTATGAILGAH